MNGRAQATNACLLTGRWPRVGGDITRDQADEHQNDDRGAEPHMAAKGAQLGRIRVGNITNDKIAKAQIGRDHQADQPMEDDEERVIAGDGHGFNSNTKSSSVAIHMALEVCLLLKKDFMFLISRHPIFLLRSAIISVAYFFTYIEEPQ